MDKKNIRTLCTELFAKSGNVFPESMKSQQILNLILDIISGMSNTEIFKKYGNIDNVESIRKEVFSPSSEPCPKLL